ncbi:SCE4755 family polysaccharide monooxygenase-like protein [Polyangium jinanense]|uniref:Lytic polysaccharide monooxygenase n=1 Tax=Polyangium jinanense TaxID=2829994 RepID=A0A9X3WZL7_9BACT|nr:SCE4755 family polysaccharide monooxygenase-like protein [Polyangium jinanense]MDC3954951.1 lytic polysaccharide monooxygenase [Polyangium jinanense]MDC3981279.1 lytic polysaccharide monooxygenase [Polyangium jinanense]
MHSRSPAFFAFAAVLLAGSSAFAHAVLMNPQPLTNDDNAKSGPCGCYFGAAPEDPAEDGSATACPASGYKVTDLVVGQPLQVTWKETVNHNGKFRVALSTKSIDTVKRADLDAAVFYEANDANAQSGGLVSATITVPDTPCQNCVIQLRQFMEGASKPYYYSCAAVNITDPNASSSASSSTAASSSSSSGAGGAGGEGGGGGGMGGSIPGDVGPGPAPFQESPTSGVCSASPSAPGSPAALALVLAGLVARVARKKTRR